MTQNEINLFWGACQWVDEKPNTRSWKGEYHNDVYGWNGPEHVCSFWCYDSEIQEGFFATVESPIFYTEKEMKEERKQKLLAELKEANE